MSAGTPTSAANVGVPANIYLIMIEMPLAGKVSRWCWRPHQHFIITSVLFPKTGNPGLTYLRNIFAGKIQMLAGTPTSAVSGDANISNDLILSKLSAAVKPSDKKRGRLHEVFQDSSGSVYQSSYI